MISSHYMKTVTKLRRRDSTGDFYEYAGFFYGKFKTKNTLSPEVSTTKT